MLANMNVPARWKKGKAALDKFILKFSQLIKRYPKLVNIPLWVAAMSTGIISVLFANLFREAERISLSLQGSYWFFLISPLCFFTSWLIVRTYAPEAQGSGIPQVMAAIQLLDRGAGRNQFIDRLLGVRTILVKIISAAICVIGAGAIGREGPTIQVAAGIFFLTFTIFRPIFSNINPEYWLVAGGGAGIAAAFNTPLGGLVYAIEELATKHFNQFKTTLITAVMISGFAALWLAGNYLYFATSKLGRISFIEHVYAVFLGLTTGALGALFGKILLAVSRFKMNVKKFSTMSMIALGCGLLVATIAYYAGPEAVGPGKHVVVSYLNGTQTGNWMLTLSRFFTPIITYAVGGAGGIFAPSLAAGASVGSFFGDLINSNHASFFTIMGMIGFLTGVTYAPFTSMVLVLEMTDRHSVILPMMLTTISAYAAAKLIHPRSFYESACEYYCSIYGIKNKD